MPLSEMPPAFGSEDGNELPHMRARPPGPFSRSMAERLESHECPALGARRDARAEEARTSMAPVVYAAALGSNVVDVDGNRYVDLAAGFGSLLLGHRPLSVARALAAQQDRLWMALGDLYPSDAKVAAVERIAQLYPRPGARVLLGQSGSDAITAALKTACLFTGKPGILAFRGAYHGLDYAPLSALGLCDAWREPFAEQLNSHVSFAPYPRDEKGLDASLDAARGALAKGDVGSVLVEPILGRGGCVVPPFSFLSQLGALAREAGALLVADEIWTGLGRAGKMLASTHSGTIPDLICLGKGLGGGLPLSACIGPEEIMRAWQAPAGGSVVHTGTFHGAPLACATAIATLQALRSQHLEERSHAVGARLRSRLSAALAKSSSSAEVRGAGLMIGLSFAGGGTAVRLHRRLLEAGFLVTLGGIDSEVLVLTPPLNIAENLLEAFVETLKPLLGA